MTYSWNTFNLDDARNGLLVGVPSQTPTENIDDISKAAGPLLTTNQYKGYMVVINGKTAYLDYDGKVIASVPSNAYLAGTQMYLATALIVETVGTTVSRTGSAETGYSQKVDISNMEPRDTFAIQILSAMLGHTEKPESFDDAKITMYCRAAYRWAHCMMMAAANTRHGKSTTPSTQVNVNSGDLQSNTEKLLYNIADSLKNGVVIKPKTGEPLLTETKVKEVPTTSHVTIDGTPTVAINGTPNVNVANSPSVSVSNTPSSIRVSNMPTEPISIRGTVSVSNTPSSIRVSNMPTEPISIRGTVSVDNFPSSD